MNNCFEPYLACVRSLSGKVIQTFDVVDNGDEISITVNNNDKIRLILKDYGESKYVEQWIENTVMKSLLSYSSPQIRHEWKEEKLISEEVNLVPYIQACVNYEIDLIGEQEVSTNFFGDYIMNQKLKFIRGNKIAFYEFYRFHQDDFPTVAFFNVNDSLLYFSYDMVGEDGLANIDDPFPKLESRG